MMKNIWLVVSYCTGDLGAWLYDTRDEAIKRKREIESQSDSEDTGNVDLFYGNIHESRENLK